MEIIAYDFDKTVYHGDSSTHFTLWCFRHFPRTWLALSRIIGACFMYVTKIWDKTRFKSQLFSYLRGVPNIDDAVAKFWSTHEQNLKSWYMATSHENDVIISASPEFLLRDICKKIGVKALIATDMDKKTGMISGKNCYHAEKVLRFRAEFPDGDILKFYSDSRSDTPLAEISQKAYLVTGDKIQPW